MYGFEPLPTSPGPVPKWRPGWAHRAFQDLPTLAISSSASFHVICFQYDSVN